MDVVSQTRCHIAAVRPGPMLVVSLRVVQVLSQFRVISSGAPEDAGPRRVAGAERWSGGGRRDTGVTGSAAAVPADPDGQSDQPRPSRHHLPERSRATPRPSAAGHCDPARCRSGQPKHQAGLQGRIPQLQPEPQLAAGLHHRIPAAPAAARAHRRGLPAAPARQRVLPSAPGRAVQRPWRPQHPV
jgi:hypothetical protein